MKAYGAVLRRATISDETRLAVMKRIEATIAEGEGKIDNVEDWGKRKLAYEINGLTEGDYTSSISTQTPPTSRSSIACCASPTRWSATRSLFAPTASNLGQPVGRSSCSQTSRIEDFVMSINKVVITGNLTRDPELRETPSGFRSFRSAWLSMTVAATLRPSSGKITRTS